MKAFGAQKAWRCWSDTDPTQHIASYQFPDRAALDRGTAAEINKPLVEDFDRVWPGIPRTREVMTVVEEIGGAASTPPRPPMPPRASPAPPPPPFTPPFFAS